MAKKIFLTIFDTFVNAFLDFAHRNCEEKPAKNHDELHVVVAVGVHTRSVSRGYIEDLNRGFKGGK